MANDYDTTAKNVMLDALAAVMVRVHVHSGDPGGANSDTNAIGSPQAITWNAASGGSVDSSNAPAFSISAGQTVSWVSFWNSANTVRYAKKDVTDEVFGGAGTYTLTDADFDLNDA